MKWLTTVEKFCKPCVGSKYWKKFIKNSLIDSLLTPILVSTYNKRISRWCREQHWGHMQSLVSDKVMRLPSLFTILNPSAIRCYPRTITYFKQLLVWTRGDSGSNASLVLVTRFIPMPPTECNHSRLASLKFPFALIVVGTIVGLWRWSRNNDWEVLPHEPVLEFWKVKCLITLIQKILKYIAGLTSTKPFLFIYSKKKKKAYSLTSSHPHSTAKKYRTQGTNKEHLINERTRA